MANTIIKSTEPELIEKNIDRILHGTHIAGIGEEKIGKVRDIYTQPDKLILVSTDRHSSFDRIIAHIPFKGQVLNQVSNFWFDATRDIVQNHILSLPDPNVTVGKKCQMLPIEMVVRGYITGITSTSLWSNYAKGQRDFGDFVLPDGMTKNQKLETPLLTPTTKSDLHDENLSAKQIVERGIVSTEIWEKLQDAALKLFTRGQEIAFSKGLILVDTKYEFGLDENSQLTLIDEIHTPDSSRYWFAETYEKNIAEGKEPDYYDKEFLRLWFKNNCDPYKDEVLPPAPKELIVEMSRRYIEVYERLTGKAFEVDLETSIEERIAKNLESFKI